MTNRVEHKWVDGVEQRYCSGCKRWFPLDNFPKNSTRWDGLNFHCRACDSTDQGHKVRKPRYLHQIVDGVEKKRCGHCGRWLTLDCFHKKSEDSRDGLACRCKNCHRKTNQRWIEEHPDQMVAIRNLRRARLLAAPGKYTGAEFKALCKYYGNSCLNLGADHHAGPLVPDHVVPLSKGGSNSIDNIQPLCTHCNGVKGTKTIDHRVGLRLHDSKVNDTRKILRVITEELPW